MFKTKVEAEERVRKVTTEFTATGLGASALDDFWIVLPGLPMPSALELYSKPHVGEIPATAIRWVYNETAHAAYVRDNQVRPEPAPPVLLTAEGVCQRLGLSEAQFRSARQTGFPKPTGHRDVFDGDGIPTGQIPLWHLEAVSGWAERVKALGVGL
jgi:hypothetical protein